MIISDISEATRVREIRGLSPTIAIHQKTVSNNPRSTVGTITEIYDFYRLLFSSIGTPHCPNHPEISLERNRVQDIVESVSKYGEDTRFHILIPLILDADSRDFASIAKKVSDMGFVRFQIDTDTYSVADTTDRTLADTDKAYVVIDRLLTKVDDTFPIRLTDSLRIALEKGNGYTSLFFLGEEVGV
jgi:excinuclease ABC subunit A